MGGQFAPDKRERAALGPLESAKPHDGWPAISYEQRTWRPRLDQSRLSSSMRRKHRGPYRSAVLANIADLEPRLSGETQVLVDEASRAITAFDVEMGADVAPFAAILLRSEATSSSIIENLTSGARQIALADIGGGGRHNAIEIVGNVRAMQTAIAAAEVSPEDDDSLTTDSILRVHDALLGETHPEMAGRWRTEQVWIGGDDFGPHGADYIPPHHERVPDAIVDLVAFTERDDIPVLTQAAIAHAQFENIHPFPDGNGRTGRALLHAALRTKGMTRNAVVPISAGLLTDTDAYFAALNRYRDGDIEAIATEIAHASFRAVANSRALAQDVRATRGEWTERITARRDAAAHRLADLLLRQPIVDSHTVSRELGIPKVSALSALSHLSAVDVVREFTGYKRNQMWEAREIITALDDFAIRAGKRTFG